MILVKVVYELSRKLPKSELFGLVSQLQRAVVAIPLNIAEGYKRGHRAEYIQFLYIASGSGAEVETQLLLVKELYPEFVKECETALLLVEEVLKMLNSLITSLRKDPAPYSLHPLP